MIGNLISSFTALFYGTSSDNKVTSVTKSQNIINLHTYNKDDCTKSNYYETTAK
jgi:hypothetical protein